MQQKPFTFSFLRPNYDEPISYYTLYNDKATFYNKNEYYKIIDNYNKLQLIDHNLCAKIVGHFVHDKNMYVIVSKNTNNTDLPTDTYISKLYEFVKILVKHKIKLTDITRQSIICDNNKFKINDLLKIEFCDNSDELYNYYHNNIHNIFERKSIHNTSEQKSISKL